MLRTLLFAAAALALAAAPLPAMAKVPVDVEYVRGVAFDKGIVTIKEIELDDGVWEVEGRDDTGHKIEIEIDAASGQIVKIKRR